MKNSKDLNTVTVKVSPALKEFLLSINGGSDILLPSRCSRLWGLLRQYLTLVPNNYKPIPISGKEDSIRIAIYAGRNFKSWNQTAKKVIEVNTLYRNYLDGAGQKIIANHLSKSFKQTFRSYMCGALSNNPELSIHDAIYCFCDDYKITMEQITYEMLRKDWYRFREKYSDSDIIPIDNVSF